MQGKGEVTAGLISYNAGLQSCGRIAPGQESVPADEERVIEGFGGYPPDRQPGREKSVKTHA